ncbi:hypothetical protein [Streptomyces pratisoli]|uniref:hypothetical protein n=1 Tax=Streptomyces pratisoli TaxID=3139917 RepID=UPI003C12BBA7
MVRLAADPAGIRLEVHDAGAGQPNTSRPNDGDLRRGLMIVEELADDLGVEKTKAVRQDCLVLFQIGYPRGIGIGSGSVTLRMSHSTIDPILVAGRHDR